ncbi:unnamed protein product, partial [Didymodactylos carnosus]
TSLATISAKQSSSRSALSKFLSSCGLPLKLPSLSRSGQRILSIRDELARFVSRVESDLGFESFWKANQKDLIRLASLVRRYSAIPATSVPSESSFSIAGYLNRKSRSLLSSKTLKYSMFLRDKLTIRQ